MANFIGLRPASYARNTVTSPMKTENLKPHYLVTSIPSRHMKCSSTETRHVRRRHVTSTLKLVI